MQMDNKQKNRILGIVLSAVLIVVGAVGQLHGKSSVKNTISEQGYILLYNTILQHIKADYVEEIDNKDLWNNAIQGMLKATDDEHTMFLDQDDYAELKTGTKGDFGGLGIEIALRD
ncbi:MAG: peptidase S41, partial [Spirochaetia bacterium]|nr:peptidase S41 [Spirochaetia bacterium]